MNNISHLKNTAMKSIFSKPAMYFICILCCLTLENVAQITPTIIDANLGVAERSITKLKNNLKKPDKGGKGINVSISELRAILDRAEKSGNTSVFLFVVGMDKLDKVIWQKLNEGVNEKDWDNRPALILKYTAKSTTLNSLKNYSGFINPFTMAIGPGLNLPYQGSEYFAIGALCPPPRDCTLY
jgi:hypothetical protein